MHRRIEVSFWLDVGTLITTCGLFCLCLAQLLGPVVGVPLGLCVFLGMGVFDWLVGPELERWFRRRRREPKSRLDGLYDSAGTGEMPLDILADHLAESGDELADGVRWLADHGKRPELGRDGEWTWYVAPEGEPHLDAAELPWDSHRNEAEPAKHATYRSTIESAAGVVTRQVLPDSPTPPRSQLVPATLQLLGLLALTTGVLALGWGPRTPLGLAIAAIGGTLNLRGSHLATHRFRSS